jgi:excisionase family DNA binding protein
MEERILLKRLLNVEEAAQYLGMAPRTIYNAVAPKSKNPFPVKAKRIGKLVRFDIRDLDAFIDDT